MKKRILPVLMAMIMLVLSMQTIVFAEEETPDDNKVYGDAIITAQIDNAECVEIQALRDAQISVVIGLANRADFSPIEIPIEAVDMGMDGDEAELTFWLGYKEKSIEKVFLDYLSDLQGDLFSDLSDEIIEDAVLEDEAEDAIDQISSLLNEVTIEFKGLPEHYQMDAEMSSCAIITNVIIKEIVSLIEEIIVMAYPEINLEEIDGFKGLVEAVLAQEDTTLDAVIEELKAENPDMAIEIDSLFAELDEALEYMQSDEFPGLLIAGISLVCDCPVTEYYDIVQEYYKNVDGRLELVGTELTGEEEDLKAVEGTVVRAKDYVKCEYEGVTYEYKGSYNINIMFEDAYSEYDWSGYELDEFVVGDEGKWGLILRYEVVEERKDETVSLVENTDDTTNSNTDNEREAAPETGDDQNIILYLAVCMSVVGVIFSKIRKTKS